MAYRFQPPRENRTIIRAVNLLYPAFLAVRERMVRISIEPSEWRWLEELHYSRALLLPNHPSETEPSIMAGIARRLRQPFNYVATDEIFRGSEALGKPPSLPLVPVVIRYRYVGNPRPALRRGLHRLEIQLGLPPRGDPEALPDRLLRAGLAVLRGVEQEYGVGASAREEEKESIDERIAVLYDLIATRVTHILHVKMPADRSVRLRMRALYNATFDYLDRLAEGRTPYERRLHARRVAAARTCLADLWRVQNFMSISEECLALRTAERAGELLFRLEKEVYGEPRTLPWREAVVRLGLPMELADWLPQYRASRKRTVAHCTAELEEHLRTLLRSMSGVCTPL